MRRYLWKKRRKLLIWLSFHVPERVEMAILDWLYPDDLRVQFPDESCSP